jgi:hypothetical protein
MENGAYAVGTGELVLKGVRWVVTELQCVCCGSTWRRYS